MNVEKIAKKLRPLMPEQVQHWIQMRDIVEPDLKSLIDKQIVSTAYDVLGDFHSKILLSLPPLSKSKGSINLGTILYDKKKWDFGIKQSELLQNMSIFGRSGAGKTNISFHILEQLLDKKIPFLFLDWKRTARHLLPHLNNKVQLYTAGRSLAPFPFNPFVVPPGIEDHVYINQVVDVMADAYTLGDGAKSIVQKAILACYTEGNRTPTPNDVLEKIKNIPDKDRVKGWKITANRAIESLAYSGMISKDKTSQEALMQNLLQQNTFLELDALGQNSKQFLIPLLCLWLYSVQLGSAKREQLSFVLFIEEAHHVLYKQENRAKETLLEMLLRQCRELGIGIIVIDQHPHLVSSAAIGNTYTSICLNQKDPTDINKAAALSLVDSDNKHYFSMLPVGQGIIKLQDRWHSPFLVQFPLMNVQKGSVTDEVISHYYTRNMSHSARKTSVLQDTGAFGRIRLKDTALNAAMLAFLEDTLLHKDDGVQIRYSRLGLSAGSGNHIKEALIKMGWLDYDVIPHGRTRKVVLRLSKKAREALGVDSGTEEYGSIVHEYWKRFYKRKFEGEGYKTSLEVPREDGRTDLVACKDGESIAVEVETGKSDIVWNAKQNLLAGHDKIMIVATDEKAFEKVERQLAREGLIGLGRVDVVLREG